MPSKSDGKTLYSGVYTSSVSIREMITMNKIKQYIAGTLVAVALGAGMMMLPRSKEIPQTSIKYA